MRVSFFLMERRSPSQVETATSATYASSTGPSSAAAESASGSNVSTWKANAECTVAPGGLATLALAVNSVSRQSQGIRHVSVGVPFDADLEVLAGKRPMKSAYIPDAAELSGTNDASQIRAWLTRPPPRPRP